MKNTLKIIYVLTMATMIWSCEKEAFTPFEESNSQDITTQLLAKVVDSQKIPFTTNLMAGQHHLAGTVSVAKDGENLMVTYKTNTDSTSTKSWSISATHLFVGDCELMPTTKAGNPKIGHFPYKEDHAAGTTEYTYSIPLSTLGDCFCIAAHAVVNCSSGVPPSTTTPTEPTTPPTTTPPTNPLPTGPGSKSVPGKGKNKDKGPGNGGDESKDDECGEETAWGAGQGFPGNSWAMFINVCDDETNPETPTTPSNPIDDGSGS